MTRLHFALLSLSLTLVLTVLTLLPVRSVTAQTTPRNALVALAPLAAAPKVELVAIILDADLVDAGDRTTLSGQLTFKLHNTDRLTPTELLVGFPSWGGGSDEFNDKAFSQFVISLNGKPVQAEWQNASIRLGNETRPIRWLAFPVRLVEDERATVQVAFKQDLADSALPTALFAQAPAILWKGFVGSARFSFHFPTLTTPEQFRALSPKNSTFDGKSITWLFNEFNPDAPITVQLIRPRLWRDITTALAAVGRGDARAALTLGGLYAQLARATQNVSDWSLALAAYQRAGELNSNGPDGPLEAARLFEARLRGDYGKVADDSALRAAALEQWQRVLKLSPNSAEARDAVAQHALALAQVARRAGRFSAALVWLDTARTVGSTKVVSPLLESETRANQAGLAMQQIDTGRWPELFKQVQSDVLGPEVKAELAAFLPRFTSVQVSVSLEGDRQTVETRLAPFPATSSDHETALNAWIDSARKQPNGRGTLEVDGDIYVITLHLPAVPLRTADLPSAAELPLLREALSPAELRITHSDGVLMGSDALNARYAFAESQRSIQAKIDEIDRMLKALTTASRDEAQETTRRLRVRLLEQYRAGWQSLLNGSGVRVTWTGATSGFGKPEQWDLRPGDAQTLQAQRTTYQYTAMALSGGFCLALLGLATIGVLVLIRRRPASQQPPLRDS